VQRPTAVLDWKFWERFAQLGQALAKRLTVPPR